MILARNKLPLDLSKKYIIIYAGGCYSINILSINEITELEIRFQEISLDVRISGYYRTSLYKGDNLLVSDFCSEEHNNIKISINPKNIYCIYKLDLNDFEKEI